MWILTLCMPALSGSLRKDRWFCFGRCEILTESYHKCKIAFLMCSGGHFPFKHKNAILKITLKRGSTDYANSTEAGQKSVHLFFMRYEFSDETIETTWGQNVYITLDTPLAKNEERTIYLAIPPIKGNANQHTQPAPIYTDGYNKTVNLRSTGLTPTTLTFNAGLVYETNITYSCPQVVDPGEIW